MARPPSTDPRVERAAESLPPLEREVLFLSAARGLCNRAIAERLGMTPAEAERLLARALVGFDRALERARRPWWRFW